MDSSMEKRVWQRVSAPGGRQKQEDLRRLLTTAREAAGDYRFLAARLTGPAGEQAKKLHESGEENAACLRGILLLLGAVPGDQKPLPIGRPSVRRVLEGCYHRARMLAGEYTARSAEAEFGMVFLGLAQREQENCMRLASLLGKQ